MPDPETQGPSAREMSNEELATKIAQAGNFMPEFDDLLMEASRRLRALSPRPIEGAPRDGRALLLRVPDRWDLDGWTVAFWGDAPYPHENRTICVNDWWFDCEASSNPISDRPTHFIDLSALEVPSEEDPTSKP